LGYSLLFRRIGQRGLAASGPLLPSAVIADGDVEIDSFAITVPQQAEVAPIAKNRANLTVFSAENVDTPDVADLITGSACKHWLACTDKDV
jgi:hypothetical protein